MSRRRSPALAQCSVNPALMVSALTVPALMVLTVPALTLVMVLRAL
jgi:hypothetical protein